MKAPTKAEGAEGAADTGSAPAVTPLATPRRDFQTIAQAMAREELALLRAQAKTLLEEIEVRQTREVQLVGRIAELQEALALGDGAAFDGALGARLSRLERDVEVYRAGKHSAEVQLLDARASLRNATQRLEQLQGGLAYRIGKAIVDASWSWSRIIRLPVDLIRLARVNPEVRRAGAGRNATSDFGNAVDAAIELADREGLEAALKWARAQQLKNTVHARVLIDLARHIYRTDTKAAVDLAKEAARLEPKDSRIRLLAFRLMEAGSLIEAADLLRTAISAGAILNGAESRRADDLFVLERLAVQGISLPRTERKPLRLESRRLVIFAPQSLPFHWSAAAMRAHALAQASVVAGWEPVVVTPPGYPRRQEGGGSSREAAYGITYVRLPEATTVASSFDVQARQTGTALAHVMSELGSALVVAPSDLQLAYPALVSARVLGATALLDCHHLSGSQLEGQLLARADGVLARGAHLTPLLGALKVDPGRVRLIADIVPDFQPDASVPSWREDPALAGRIVIGFIGDPDDDFDLGLLPRLLDKAVAAGHDAALFVAGVGSRFQDVRQTAESLGHGGRILFAGRLRYGSIDYAYRCVDVVVVPGRAEGIFERRIPFEIANARRHGCSLIISGALRAEAEHLGTFVAAPDAELMMTAFEAFRAAPARSDEAIADQRALFGLQKAAESVKSAFDTIAALPPVD